MAGNSPGKRARDGGFWVLLMLVLNSVSWFYLMVAVTGHTVPEIIPHASSLRPLFYVAVLASMLAGPLVAERFDRMRFIRFWIVLGVISSLIPLFLPSLGEIEVAALLVLWGVSFGIGFPSCLALIPMLTNVDRRGRTGGMIFLATYLVLFLLIVGMPSNVFSISIMLAVWRGLGLGAFLLRRKMGDGPKLAPVSYLSVLRNGKFFLYFIPWMAFCLVNYFGVQILDQSFGQSMTTLMLVMEFSVGAFCCLICGRLMDLKGRRPMVIAGATMLGLGYALLSVFPPEPFARAFFIVADSLAFGIFTVAFLFTVWGDMSEGMRSEKFYALGNICVPAAVMLSLFASSWLKTVNLSSAYSLASFFIFLGIVFLIFAPELLPERVLRKRELSKYVENVKKTVRESGA
jgi:MFS family permease